MFKQTYGQNIPWRQSHFSPCDVKVDILPDKKDKTQGTAGTAPTPPQARTPNIARWAHTANPFGNNSAHLSIPHSQLCPSTHTSTKKTTNQHAGQTKWPGASECCSPAWSCSCCLPRGLVPQWTCPAEMGCGTVLCRRGCRGSLHRHAESLPAPVSHSSSSKTATCAIIDSTTQITQAQSGKLA